MTRKKGPKASTMTGQQWKHLRLAAQLSVPRAAELLGCTTRTIYNIEAGESTQAIGSPLGKFLVAITYPPIRALLEMAQDHAEQLLAEKETH